MLCDFSTIWELIQNANFESHPHESELLGTSRQSVLHQVILMPTLSQNHCSNSLIHRATVNRGYIMLLEDTFVSQSPGALQEFTVQKKNINIKKFKYSKNFQSTKVHEHIKRAYACQNK